MSESLRAKKSLGQHFLKSKAALNALISAPEVEKGDYVIEIGPGKGVLTRALLETGAQVLAFELDERMLEFLKEEFAGEIASGQLQLIHADILDIQIDEYMKGKDYKIVANIPYYITNMIIRKFLEAKHQPTDMCLLIQKEVAQRIVARDGKESLLSLSVSAYGTPRYVAKVEKKYFAPAPKVDSAIIHITDISHNRFSSHRHERAFFGLLHLGFAHRRKQLQANLKKIYPAAEISAALNKLLLPQSVRAEDISLEKWIDLLDLLESHS